MFRGRVISLLCASFACAASAAAQEADRAPFVTQVRIPARNVALDAFAWRDADGVLLDRGTLAALGLVVPDEIAGDPVPISAIPGLAYEEDAAGASIIIACAASCYAPQILAREDAESSPTVTTATGGYINYDLNAQWIEDEDALFGGVAEAVLFGAWGLVESSWLAQSGPEDGATRLETRWTMDFPENRLRLRVGDSAMIAAGSAPFRFAGVQLGRHFGLTPSLITYPTPTLAGEAENASTVELYVDGALRSRERVNAGPFVFEDPPLVSGAGEAQIVVTDLLGRSEMISRPFFVSTSLLRAGLSDWSLAAGAERADYGRESASYAGRFFSGRYRRGLTNAITAEGALELTESGATVQLGAVAADHRFGQVRLARAESEDGAANDASWHRDARAWAAGVQWQSRNAGFHALGDGESTLRSSVAANFSLDLGAAGHASLTAAEVTFFDEPLARTLTLSYAPDLGAGALSFRLLYTEHEDRELAFGVTWSLELRGDVSGQLGADIGADGATLRASAQRPADSGGGVGWRVRAAAGEETRADIALNYIGPLGESRFEAASTRFGNGARASHAGSIGWIEQHRFAARRIAGAFALVATGAAYVGVARDRLPVGASNRAGHLLAVNLRPYETNTIAIAADDLPLDRAPTTLEARVTPAEGAGVVVRFPQASVRLVESRVRWRGEGPDLRGAVLVRVRDGARFPVGREGRIVLLGILAGDVLHLDGDARCTAQADSAAVERGLVLGCAA